MTLLAILGALLSLAGMIWIVVVAFQNGDQLWGVGAIFCGIVTIIYAIQNFYELKIPLAMFVGGIGLRLVYAAAA